jgi:hypothetical protein
MNLKLAIKSYRYYEARRKAQLETWLPAANIDYFFVIGDTPRLERKDNTLFLPVDDAYQNLAPKVWYACGYALEEGTDFLCILDDDTYLRPERLLALPWDRFDYYGFVRTNTGAGKYAGIPYMQGSCFVLSRLAMACIVGKQDAMCFGIPDDIAVGHCLDGCVSLTHDRNFVVGDPYPPESLWPTVGNKTIAIHSCPPFLSRNGNPATMYGVHRHWLRNSKRNEA